MNHVWVAVGSALGGMARYWCSGFAARLVGEWFPWGTLIVNVSGSLVIGAFAAPSAAEGHF
jgi:CrcB protein